MTNSDNDATKVIFQKAPAHQETVIMPDRLRAAGRTSGTAAPSDAAVGATVFVPFGHGTGASEKDFNPVAGWLVIVDGPGRGNFRPVFYGQNSIGRNADLKIVLDYGDNGISREAHAFLIYDEVAHRFFIKDNGQSNIIRLNGAAVLTLTDLHDRDRLTIGQTTLLFVALCDANFDWLTNDAAKAT